MGVKGLSSFIEQHPSLFSKHHLHDTRLVFDGNALFFDLYFDRPPCDDGHHGGRYQSYAAKCHLFFLNLSKCNITPYLVFDGAREEDNKKLAETKSRRVGHIKTAVAIFNGLDKVAVSPCASLVFRRVVDELGIPYACCEFEADAETAALANEWNCPAVSGDSDFYIMDLRSGYLPLDHFEWKRPKKLPVQKPTESRRRHQREAATPSGQLHYIECMKYDRGALCRLFHINQALLPILATAIGNDYKDTFGTLLDPFHSFVQSKFSQKTYSQLITSYFSWLSQFETVEEATGDMVRFVKVSDEEVKLRKLIQASLEMYHLSSSETLAQFSGHVVDASQSKLVACASVPPWFVILMKKGKVPAHCADIMCTQRVFLGVQLENPHEASAGFASLYIRSVLYGILLKRTTSKRPHVEEYAQSKGKLELSIVEPVYEIQRECGTRLALPTLEDIPGMNDTQCREILLATMGVCSSTIDSIPGIFQLAACVTIYLLHHAVSTIYSDHVIALIFSWLHGVAVSREEFISKGHDTPEHLQVGLENSDVRAILENTNPFENKYKESRRLNLDVVQAVAQWQQCMRDVVSLNKVLSDPCPHPDMAVLFNGPLIHSLSAILKSKTLTEQLEWVASQLLPGTRPRVQALFKHLVEPARLLLTPWKVPKKHGKSKESGRKSSRGQGKQPPSTQTEGAVATGGFEDEVAYAVSTFNSFGLLDEMGQ